VIRTAADLCDSAHGVVFAEHDVQGVVAAEALVRVEGDAAAERVVGVRVGAHQPAGPETSRTRGQPEPD
jgi:hypothetical protein